MNIRGVIWTGLLFIIGSGDSYASHISGAEITYKQLHGTVYQFTLKVFRDCRECKFNNTGGGDNSSNCNDVPNLVIKGAIGTSYASNQLGLVEIERRNIRDLTQACFSSVSKCRPGSNNPYGYEEHVFEGIFDFNSLINSGYCKFDVSISMSSRSVNINTMMSEQNFFSYTMLNLCDGLPNQSTEFKANPQFIYQINQSNFQALEVVNIDNDSLVFSLGEALVNRNQSIAYAAGRNGDMPYNYYCLSGSACAPNLSGPLVEGFYCSGKTGDIAFTPIQNNQGGVVVVECAEWKKNSNGIYFLAGIVRRDVYGDVITGNNNLPSIKNNITDITLCENESYSLDLNIEDIPWVGQPSDSVYASVSTAMKGVYLDKLPINSAPYFKYTLHIDPSQGQTGDFLITLNITDNHCPLNGSRAKTFTVRVLKSRSIKISSSVKNCGNFEAYSLNFNNRNIFWTIRDKQNNIVKQQLSKKINTLLPSGGDYIIETYVPAEGSFCETRQFDTVHVNDFKTPQIDMGSDVFVCNNSIVSLNPKILTVYDSAVFFANGTPINQFPYTYSAQADRNILFRVEQKNGCIAEDIIQVKLHPILIYKKRNDTVCVNGVFPKQIRNILVDKSLIQLIDYSMIGPHSTLDKVNSKTWNLNLISPIAQVVQLNSLLEDNNHCVYLDTSFLHIIEPSPIDVSCPTSICINASPLSLNSKPGGVWECVSMPALIKNNTFYPDGNSYSKLILKYSDMNQCINTKTFYINTIDTVPLSFGHSKEVEICENNGLFELKGIPSGGHWYGDHQKNEFFNPIGVAGKKTVLQYVYTNTSNCNSASGISIYVEKLPALKVIADKERLCIGDVLTLQALSSSNSGGYWYTDGDGSFEQPVNVITSYRPKQGDVAKGKLKFSYTLQTNGICGNVVSEVIVLVTDGPKGDIIKTYPESICEPAHITFISDYKRLEKQYWFVNDSLMEEFDYNFDFTTVLKAGNYVIKTKVYDSTCEALAISDNITVLPKPMVKMGSNPSFKISREYPRLYLKDLSYSRNGHTVNWYFNNDWIGNSREFYYKADDTKDSFYIRLVATNSYGGCQDSINQLFVFIPINQLYIPDAFSPDAKGPQENNTFRTYGPPMKEFGIEIFNKFGEKIFISDHMDEVWDGTYKNTACMQGVYFYKVITTDYEGISRDYSGTVTLIR